PGRRRPRVLGEAITFKPATEANQTGTGVFERTTGTGSEAISGTDRTAERLTSNEIDSLKQEIARLKASKSELELKKGQNLERVVRILEGSSSPKVQEAAHKYIRERIGEKAEGRASAGVGKGVGAALIISAALAFYIAHLDGKEDERDFYDPGASINAR
ncbi:MAG: hypothetical protein K8F91_14510, partial [Candidatus Obscuribacterales bacterium]|nr:hypothetical protein [Candidatus Obscuribacterales bacterium]